jgi:DNA invertase Pin-like site-specific DNA recombinase
MRQRRQTRTVNPYIIDQRDLHFPLVHGLIIVQTRQSYKGAYGNNSTEIHTEKMVEFGRSLCVTPDRQVIVVNENMLEDGSIISVSGSLPPEKRHGLLRSYALIGENRTVVEPVVLVLAYAEDRLFRDDTGIYYNEFMDILSRYDVRLLVYTSRKLYDFNNGMDKRLFRMMCEYASEDLKLRNIRLQGARQHMAEKGQHARGSLPAGLIRNPTTNRADPLYLKPIEYTPWAEPVRRLFKRYYDTGSLITVFYEIADQPIFPHLPEGMKNYSGFRTSRQHGVYPEGFSLSRFGLKFILTNPLFIGYWFNPASGEWIPGNHPAIVPPEHFWYAFLRLSPVLLDGSPNPDYLHSTTGRNTSNLDETDGLFHGLFVTDNEQWRVTRRILNNKGKKELYYQLYDYNHGNKPIHLLHIRADEFDAALLPVLVRKLKDTKELEGFRQYGESLQAIVATRTANLQRLLAENEAEQRATEIRIDTLTDPQLISRQEEKYKGLRARHATLEQQLADDSQPAKRRRRILSYYELIELLGPRLEQMEPTDRRIIVESTIDSIFIRLLSPSFLLLRIDWFAWTAQTFLYRRDNVAAGTWDDAEMATLKRLWATASPEELLLALPERTWSAIRGARKGQQLPGRWGRWEPCRLPAWAEAGYCAADVTILDQYEL